MTSGNSGWSFDNSYARLPDVLFTPSEPEPVQAPQLTLFNRPLAQSLGLLVENPETPVWAEIFAGNRIPAGAAPIAQAYAGHQFGHFTMLGDGRAILLGEQITPEGLRMDVQLKGSGRTVYSRRGDGRAALGPMLREFVISEAMHALGIPTTRSLAVVLTGERVQREQALPGAVLTRIASSHIRVGTFEYAARLGHPGVLEALADHTIRRHYPELFDTENRYVAMLHAAIEHQASLIAKWMNVGFVHGVMNTDNMALSGETIDYGPCAFLDTYDPATVFSSIDHNGRYSYINQPGIAQWNLARLAETLLPLLHPDEEQSILIAQEALEGFTGKFQTFQLAGMRSKLGLYNEEPEDAKLVSDLLEWMHSSRADFTNTFRTLDPENAHAVIPESWTRLWNARLARQPQAPDEVRKKMLVSNPAIIPRNHKVEEALVSATESGNLNKIERLLGVLNDPLAEQPAHSEYSSPPPAGSPAHQTFCGT